MEIGISHVFICKDNLFTQSFIKNIELFDVFMIFLGKSCTVAPLFQPLNGINTRMIGL